ncbi:protein-tyrosine phosphatase family protein [Microbacterium invictum]|uniref:Protein-tyrosine phosphatase family protein n=1 Tax=Microbacterium invictum TaxID=515415 RepID=A0ABZ0VDG5_9MICO|nr:protein-tyrosine phosphatase family protein [Microbacterium invictum]WQB69847.1 protein-tyrosine phosphatase family protein [Microbacterium invictum]
MTTTSGDDASGIPSPGRDHPHRGPGPISARMTPMSPRMTPWWPDLTGVVTLPSGRQIRGRGLRGGSTDVGPLPDFGVYLTARLHEERWPSRWVAWPDFRLPRTPSDAIDALREAYDRAATDRVEIACDGGTGRTGTALALLARFDGVPAGEAVAWVRATYRPGAVETPWQRRFVRRVPLSV